MQPKSLILASTSPYRRQLLERLELPFNVVPPDIDETSRPGESPRDLVARLAAEKAAAVAARHADAVVIGCDQVAQHDGRAVGKPGDAARACRQLQAFSGARVEFLSAFSVQCAAAELRLDGIVTTEVAFRTLSPEEIHRYVELDRPLDCAGAFRSEAAGSMLLRHLRSDDPTAIVGLPLIALASALRKAGFELP